MIHVLGSDYVHFYLLEENGEVTIVDPGLSGYRDTLEPALAAAGRSIGDVKAIVLTHADSDHVGFAAELQRTHGTPVYVHRLHSDRTREGRTKKTEGTPLSMLAMLRHSHARRLLRHMIGNGGAKQAKVAEVMPFEDGEELAVPGRLRAVHTPGHTEGHAVLYAPGEDALFVGDALNNIDLLTGEPGARVPPPAMNTSTGQARDSLSRIEELDARTVYFRSRRPVRGRQPRGRRRGSRQTLSGRGRLSAARHRRGCGRRRSAAAHCTHITLSGIACRRAGAIGWPHTSHTP
jgi:glyoxylase-like metal-dependent hydrolase (beta-lactamase superfamily II)